MYSMAKNESQKFQREPAENERPLTIVCPKNYGMERATESKRARKASLMASRYSTALKYLPFCQGFAADDLQIDTAFSPWQ